MAWIRAMARAALILAAAAAALQRPRFRIGIVFRQPLLVLVFLAMSVRLLFAGIG